MAPRTISFLSDYGHEDEFVGICHGVIARLCPLARVIDITHGILRHDVRGGAIVLARSLPFMPAGVHLAVVDPGVGALGAAARRAVALRVAADERLLVGPDNGLLTAAAERLGGVLEAVEIGRSPHRLEPVSATFHGRDIFAPVAARLAAGDELAEVGEQLEPNALRALALPTADLRDGVLLAHALSVDRFGNVGLDATHEQLAGSAIRLGGTVELELDGQRTPARYARTFADVGAGELLLYEDAHRMAALAVNRGSASELLGIERDDPVRIRPSRGAVRILPSQGPVRIHPS